MTVESWWHSLAAVAAFNLLAWSLTALFFIRRRNSMSQEELISRHWQLALCAVYVLGCAYRSVFTVYDVPRICMLDTWLSSVVVGRSIATLAELCFVAQWALLMRDSSRATGSLLGRSVSLALVPIIGIAEMCSWFSILTTSNVGHVIEESLWGFSVLMLVISVAVILPRLNMRRRIVLAGWCIAGLAYVAFMFSVDVPMYWARWIADEANGRRYMSITQGLFDISHRRVVSLRWEDWKNEVAWMSLYFSVAVWISISLVYAPFSNTRPVIARQATLRQRTE